MFYVFCCVSKSYEKFWKVDQVDLYPRLPIIRNQPLQEFSTHAGGSVCVTSADSREGFPVSNTRGWYALFQQSSGRLYRRVSPLHGPRKVVFFIELVFHTDRSPHIGSKLCSIKGTQLDSRFNVCTPESQGAVLSSDDPTLELPGSPEVWVLSWGVY